MNQIIINGDLCAVGMRVVRGPGWEWENQDGGKGSAGTIIDEPSGEGWVSVTWDKGGTYSYRVGAEGKYDLAMYEPFSTTGINLTDKQQTQRLEGLTHYQKLQEARQHLVQSIQKSYSLIEKSNTKHGNSNTSGTPAGAIKVRRPVIKIQGTKG